VRCMRTWHTRAGAEQFQALTRRSRVRRARGFPGACSPAQTVCARGSLTLESPAVVGDRIDRFVI